MTYEVFVHRPGAGNYGTDWLSLRGGCSKRSACAAAEGHFRQTGEAARVFTQQQVGRLVAQFGEVPGEIKH